MRVTPGASRDIIEPAGPDSILRVRVTTAGQDGQANAAMVALLAKALRVPNSALTLVQGTAARTKQIRLPPA